jgi:hypothetical protein
LPLSGSANQYPYEPPGLAKNPGLTCKSKAPKLYASYEPVVHLVPEAYEPDNESLLIFNLKFSPTKVSDPPVNVPASYACALP